MIRPCLALAFLLLATLPAAAQMLTYRGDGLTIVVNEWSEETGDVRGTIQRGAENWPFSGKFVEEGGAEILRGTFTVAGQQHPFTSREEGDGISFTTGAKTYRLSPVADPAEQKPAAPTNPLESDPAPTNPLETGPAEPANRQPGPVATNGAAQSGLPATMRLKFHTFPDVSMGGVPAYSATTPEGWTSSGKIEWSQGELPYPQLTIEILSPEGGRLRYLPAITLSYLASKPLEGFPTMPPQGTRAPDDFPRWFASAVSETNKKVSNVRLVDSRRDQASEARIAETQRATNANTQGMTQECHIITLEYDEANVRRREEATILYVKYPPIDNMNIYSETWSIFATSYVSAPAEKFEALKPQLYAVAATVRQTPQWWLMSQQLLAQLQQARSDARWKMIQERGRQIAQVSDADYARYKQANQPSDSAQRDRINSIYETSDYRDSTGDIVNLPMHYHHVFSDGKGNYVLSNNSQDKPGELWNEIKPMK